MPILLRKQPKVEGSDNQTDNAEPQNFAIYISRLESIQA